MFIHGVFYDGNADCMQGVDAGMQGVDALHPCIPASMPTMTHCNSIELTPLTDARSLCMCVRRLHIVICSYSYSYGHSSTIPLKADRYGHANGLTCKKICN